MREMLAIRGAVAAVAAVEVGGVREMLGVVGTVGSEWTGDMMDWG